MAVPEFARIVVARVARALMQINGLNL